MGANGEPDHLFIESTYRSRAPHTPRILLARVLGDRLSPLVRAVREHLADPPGELFDVDTIELASPDGFPLLAPDSDLRVGETLFLCTTQRFLLNQEPLPLVSPARTTPFQNGGGEGRVLGGAAGQRSLAGGEKDEMIAPDRPSDTAVPARFTACAAAPWLFRG